MSAATAPLFWSAVTRLGESAVVAAGALLVLVWLARAARPAAWLWLAALAAAVGLTTASKVAFMGWGVGSAALDFTGVSGHAMFAGAVYPALGAAALARWQARGRLAGAAAGTLLAVLVAASRVHVQAHSVSEVVAGCAAGLAVGLLAVALAARGMPRPLPVAALAGVLAWGTVTLAAHPEPLVPSHQLVTRLALELSGRERPWTRAELHRQPRAGRAAQAPLHAGAPAAGGPHAPH